MVLLGPALSAFPATGSWFAPSGAGCLLALPHASGPLALLQLEIEKKLRVLLTKEKEKAEVGGGAGLRIQSLRGTQHHGV